MSMAASAPAPPTAGAAGPGGTAAPGTAIEPAERGRLKIDPSVLRKIVEHAADLTPGTVRAGRTMAGVGVGETGATAKVAVTAQWVDVSMELALRYPGSVRSTVDLLRRRISDEVQRITGYQVRSIAVTVTALLPEPSPGLR